MCEKGRENEHTFFMMLKRMDEGLPMSRYKRVQCVGEKACGFSGLRSCPRKKRSGVTISNLGKKKRASG